LAWGSFDTKLPATGIGHMLPLSLSLLLIATLLGIALAALHLRREGRTRPGWQFGALHGSVGVVGLLTLLLALRGPPRGEAMGIEAFGRIAAVLLALAALAGLAMAVGFRRPRRVPGLVIGIHATIAVAGVVVLAAYTLAV
jgi:hypothetical protein